MNENILDRVVLEGTAEALRVEAPELVLPVEQILNRDPVYGGRELVRGQSVIDRISAAIPIETADRIISALRSVEARLGYEALFCGRQVNFLISGWARYVEAFRSGQKNEGPSP